MLIFSKMKEQHETDVHNLLQGLRKNKLYEKKNKCDFFKKKIELLGTKSQNMEFNLNLTKWKL